MSGKWLKRPKTMGQVLESFAVAIQDEQKRGLPRFSDEQVQRIEAVVQHLDQEQAGARPARTEDARPASPSTSKPITQRSAHPATPQDAAAARRAATKAPEESTTQKPVPASSPSQPAESSSSSHVKDTREVQSAAAASKRASTPADAPSTPAGDLPPWMIDESAEADAPPPARAERPRQPTAQRAASRAEAVREAQPRQNLRKESPRQDAQHRQAAPAQTTAAEDNAARLQHIREELGDCTRCGLCETRTHIVFGNGNPDARLFLIGEAPSRQDDESGRIFSDAAGDLLGDMLKAMTLSKEEVYITTVLKCRPPNNRAATRDELASCAPFLRKQIEAVQPEIILTLGSQASRLLLGARFPYAQNRGEWNEWEKIPVMPTWHPGYLLKFPQEKASAWKDLQKVMRKMGLK